VTVTASYPGASAETVAETVAAPIEQEINGVDDMLYSRRNRPATASHDHRDLQAGTDLDAAQVLVQNRVAVAVPRLPEEVQRLGVVTRKTSPDFLMVVNLISPDKSLDRGYISNYALTQVRDRLARIDGVGDVQLFGSARLCDARLDRSRPCRRAQPDRGRDRRGAARAERAGRRGRARPAAFGHSGQAFQLNVETQGRLTDPKQFANIVIRTDADGARSACPTSPGRAGRRRIMAPTPISRRADGDPRRLPAPGLERARCGARRVEPK
jgi:multidrug efflux pump subunit AcrB